MKPIKLIINADDLGAGMTINNAIFDLMARGQVTSATILANGPAFDDAVTRAKDFPACSFGVHLNVMEYKPLTSNPDLAPLLDSDRHFAARLFDIKLNSRVKRAIRKEWSAQIEKVRSACINISHLDSHFHAHTHPGLFLTLKAVQKAHKIGRVRLTKNVYDVDAPVDNNFLRFKKRLWNMGLRRYIATGTTSGFTEFSTFLAIASRTTLRH
ncbi:ChbG/HpnK family deacetylase, partial [candidate division GN15 bacterium]|nr:ChbG/HpnK family deacetylase [candidate division GN15 bacterium]